ncbi:uncharacterized protein LOC143287914 [Babylonia areolata]|uniref:uncharacterized protein LOC143287914 n=1 Tax=Babylonia areolata TaxID=304850 RepID=UPI003FD131BA
MMAAIQVALVLCLLAPSAAYFFESGFRHHYTYSSENSFFDQHNVTTVLKFHIHAVNGTEEGHRLHSLHVDSLVQFVKHGVFLDNPMQWNLSKTFLFLTEESTGHVRLVHCHPEDHEEMLVIKKAMVSIFSAHVQIEEDKENWSYTVNEEDHLGSLSHHYTAERTETGLKLQRKHFSSDSVFRTHEKTLHYDHRGTLHTAHATDHVLLRDQSPKQKPSVLPGEKPHNVVSSGDFPDIAVGATVTVVMDRKQPMQAEVQEQYDHLTTQTLETKPKAKPAEKLQDVTHNVSRIFRCLDQFPEKDSENRSMCVNDLRSILQTLHKDDYVQFVSGHLGRRCPSNDTSCEDRRFVLIDVVAQMGDVTSQELLVTHVLNKEPAVDEELRRVFIHCVTIKNPTEAFLKSLETLCFGARGERHGARNMTRTQSRACLAVGSAARNAQHSGEHSAADSLVDRLETWLDRHAEGDPHVSKRDTWLEETQHEAHHVSKAVLLHALGNAALGRSRERLLLHATPNRGHHLWRRAALDAMRRFNCSETARSLLASMMHDDKHTVRSTALSVFVNHPRRHEASREHEDVMLSKEYTYPAVARVKRSMFDKVLLRFKLALPKVDWKKELGSKAVGASFGLYFENGIDVLFRVLNGHVDVTVHDKVWAEIHLGIINKEWTILLVEVCYKGRLSYNINIIKDFTVNMMKDMTGAFDHIANRVIEPMEKVANDLATRYQDKDTNQPKSGFGSLAKAVKALPEKTKAALRSTEDLSQAADNVQGLPVVSKLQQLAARAQSLMEDVHTEGTDLFADLKDAAVVALPFAEKEIRGILNTVLSKLGDVSTHPRQVFSSVERSKMSFHLAMQRVLESSSIIKQATSFLSGSRSSFMNTGQELSDLAASARLLVHRLKADHSRRKREANPWADTADTMSTLVDAAVDNLKTRADAMAAKLDEIKDEAKELQQGLDQQALYTEVLKTSYQAFKEAIDMIRSRISALLGQKFHPGFPDQRRDCDGTCHCGYYPTDRDRYGHPGVDLKWDKGWKIISPVAGLVKAAGSNAVSIQPATAGFTDYEIILSNIDLSIQLNDTGTFVDAGQVIAVSAGPNGCEDSHFHLAMKRTAPDSGLCYYVDPSPYLDRMQPIPQWHQECKDFTFKHIGNVVDFSHLTEGFSELLEELERFALDVGKGLLLKAVDAIPDTDFLGPIKSIASGIVSGIDPDPANLKNMFNDAKSSMKSFFKDISTKKFSLKGLKNMFKNIPGGSGGTLSKIKGLISKVGNLTKTPPLRALKSLATGAIGRVLSSRGVMRALGVGGLEGQGVEGQGCAGSAALDSALQAGADKVESLVGKAADKAASALGGGANGSAVLSGLTSKVTSFVGGRAGMMSALKTSACQVCQSLGSALARLSKSVCIPHDDCLGIDCAASVPGSFVSVKVNMTLRVDVQQKKVTITANGRSQDIAGDEDKKAVAVAIKVLKVVDVKVKVHTSWQGGEVHLSVGVEACALGHCLPELQIVRDVKFGPSSRRKRSLADMFSNGLSLDNLESLSLDGLGKIFSDFNLPLDEISEQISGIQGVISSALEPNKDQAEPTMTAEFIKPKDFIDKGGFPVADENGELYIPFFHFLYSYPLGPVLFNMEFDAGGAFGISVDVNVQALDSFMKTTIKPWVSGKFKASMSISIVVASAGIDLIGWVMKTGFPLSLTTNFNKLPVVSKKTLELELIPIELQLQGWVQILFFINIKKTIWHYAAPAISTTLWEKTYRKDDTEPPRFPLCDGGRGKRQIRSTGSQCTVHQVKGRHPKDAAFKLEFAVDDDNSDLELSYAVGDYPGGTNVQPWTTLRGTSLPPSPAPDFPCGRPLYFLVRARNSQGLETTASCSLPTWDCTFPEGRLDAAYRCSSHPSSLKSTVILFEDSALQGDGLFHGVGYSPSSLGHEVVDWQPLAVHNSQPQPGVSGDLRYFGAPRPGRLSSNPKTSTEAPSTAACASQCLQMPTCVAFVHNPHLPLCELHEVTEGANAERIANDLYLTYERLGKAYTATLRYENLVLRHGVRYYVNADVQNVLGYRATLSSQGTMVDRTPPQPGPVGHVVSDNVTADGCHVSILQRCVEHVTGSLNHRRIIDGADSRTMFTGNRKGQTMAFTIENYHAAANWDGFKDEECGIVGYAWSVGRSVCGSEVVSFVDPHANIHNPDDWTYTGLAKDLHLPDGAYYVTVQAVSDIVHGGDLVTTVCHSTPFVVDTTPPDFHAVQEFLFDESFRFLVVYYNVSDAVSGVAAMEFGLGKTKYDAKIRRYMPFEMRGVAGNSYLVNEEFETQDGVPAWIRLKVVNNVGLSATGSSMKPILLDSTPPVPGVVLDGRELGQDICCQMSTTELCAQWTDFHDPDSYIESYDWGVGLSPGQDDVVQFHTLSGYDKQACVQVTLQHNVTYFSTVVANNKALNRKSANASSDGLLVDVTPPVAGTVSDGTDVTHDVNYTSETATVSASWTGFRDAESGLADYSVTVTVSGGGERTFPGLSSGLEEFTDHSFSLRHQDTVTVQLRANNRAGGQVTVSTDGMLVDHTPPQMTDIGSKNRSLYQLSDDALQFVWNFVDPESGVGEYRCVIFQLHQGRKTKFWPQLSDFYPINLNLSAPTNEQLSLDDLDLQNGASYSIKVTALNRAKMAATHESEAVTVDSTPPVILMVAVARAGEEEETNEEGVVMHVDQEPLWVTWSPHDTESGINTSHVCVGPVGSSHCLTSGQYRTVDADSVPTVSFPDLDLQVSTDDREVLYQAYVVTFNGAGVQSSVAVSKPFLVLKANVAGVVLDGRGVEDEDFSNDKASIAITFSGFESQACGIVGYEWGVGSSPFATDLLPYTDYGLVVDDTGTGFAQIHIMQEEGQKFYSTVRARTGHNCHQPYIVSASDGFVLDTTGPFVSFHVGARQLTSQDIVYQTSSDHLDVLWKAEDAGGLEEVQLVQELYGSSPHISQVPAVLDEPMSLKNDPSSGDSLFSALILTDKAGNERTVNLPPVTWDTTPPSFLHLACSTVVSALSPLLHCSWNTVQEQHSPLSSILVGLGNGPSEANLVSMTPVETHRRKWSYDVHHLLHASDIGYFYVILQAVNAAGLQTEETVKVINDVSPPSVGGVSVVTSPAAGFHDIRQHCQTAQDHVEVLLTGVSDPESDIRSVELALGSSKGQRDVTPFHECRMVDGMYVMENLALPAGTTVYVTARVTNHVGLYVIATSDAVVISPEPRLEVSDGPETSDVDGQSEVHVLEGRWWYSDPCPVLRAEWSVQELGGQVLVSFTAVDPSGHTFYNDGLHLENFKTYINYIRITDALNRTRVAFSDGVTVLIQRPDTAVVRDGLGDIDMDFQFDTHILSANWDAFGDSRSTLPSNQITRYEAALGTDRRLPTTRVDIHAFEDVGLSTNITFHGLNLTAKTQTYFVTVRAFSAAGSYVESSSDGIRVGFRGDITAGQVKVSGFQSGTGSIRVSWSGFDSDMDITHYYVGVSSLPPPPSVDNGTDDCLSFMHDHSSGFDVRPLQVLSEEAMAVLDNVTLEHGASYYVTVVAADRMGHCAASTGGPVLVDTTPPLQGEVKAEGYNADGSVLFVHSPHSLTVRLDEFPDPESGLDAVSVQLVSSESCHPDLDPDADSVGALHSVEAKGQSAVTMRGLALEEGAWYFVRVSVTNRAGLTTRALSLPLLLDTSPPLTGRVKLGSDWTGADRVFQQHTDTVAGMLALQSVGTAQDCVTQVDMLEGKLRKEWKPAEGQFTPQCVQFDSSGLHVLVQHNARLTDVDKGAAQSGPIAWREGDHDFLLAPAVDHNVISGVSLASPSMQPPFLRQNRLLPGDQSSPLCDSSENVCLEDRNETVKPGSLGDDTEYGMGFTFSRTNTTTTNSTKLLFWAQDVLVLKQLWIPLDFDPVAVPGHYTFRLLRRQEGGDPRWEVSFLVNGHPLASVSGLLFPDTFLVSVYGWNVGGYFPPLVSPLLPYRAATVLRGLALPLAQRPLCSYGSAFRDGVSDLKEVWVGVSDSYNASANVAPYTLVKSFCLPCLHQCPDMCSQCQAGDDRLSDGFTLLPFTLQGLSLQAGDSVNHAVTGSTQSSGTNNTQLGRSKDEFSQYQLPTYYLDVRVVDHSGLKSHVKSVGFVIDTSPPIIKSVVCFDPEFSTDVSITELGNNHTVGATWEVSEDISDIVEVRVCLGTGPGSDDIVGKVTVRKGQDQYVFEGLDPALEEGREYYVSVEVENQAGLRRKAWSNFTVHTAQPDLTAASFHVGGGVTSLHVGNVTLDVMENLDSVELDLDVPSSQSGDVEYYEMAIGTADDREDLFPRVLVGRKGTKKIAIVGGFVHRDESPVPISVGDYSKKNVSTDDQPDPSANLLHVEPGRCLRLSVFGVSKAHVSAPLDRKLVCIKRPDDVLLAADGKTHTLQLSGSRLSVDPNVTDPGAVHIHVKREDSVVKAIPGPHVFMSPVAESDLTQDVVVNYTVPTSVAVPADARVNLVTWNPVSKQWESPEETCSTATHSYDRTTRLLTARLCPQLFSDVPESSAAAATRRKRSTTSSPPTFHMGPRMFSPAVTTTAVPNQPPVVHNTTLVLSEDQGLYNFTLTYTDPEGDDLAFRLLPKQPAHGTASVTPEGELTYIPHENYAGRDTVYLQGEEVLSASNQALGMVPNVVTFNISVHITDVNDPPDIVYLPGENNSVEVRQELAVGPAAGNGLNYTVFREANSSSEDLVLGVVVFSDVDPTDSALSFVSNTTVVQPGASITENSITLDDARLSDLDLTASAGIGGKEIILSAPPNYVGHVVYDARVKDAAGSYSLQVTLNVLVVLNPCVHGVCQPRNSPGTCYEARRVSTFDPYRCHCDPGYEGQWCQTETNECNTATCSPITDCVDLVDGFRCEANTVKLLAIVLCCSLAVVLAAVGVYQLKKRSSAVGPMDDLKKPSKSPIRVKSAAPDSSAGPPGNVAEPGTNGSETPAEDQFRFLGLSYFAYSPRHNPTALHPAALGETERTAMCAQAAPAATTIASVSGGGGRGGGASASASGATAASTMPGPSRGRKKTSPSSSSSSSSPLTPRHVTISSSSLQPPTAAAAAAAAGRGSNGGSVSGRRPAATVAKMRPVMKDAARDAARRSAAQKKKQDAERAGRPSSTDDTTERQGPPPPPPPSSAARDHHVIIADTKENHEMTKVEI